MESRAAIFGHPLHAMLVDFPLALFPTAFLFDLIFLWRRDPFWRRAASALLVVGEVGAVAAIPFGLADYLLIGMPAATRRLATLHLCVGLAVAALFAVQIWLRRRFWRDPTHEAAYPSWLLALAFLSAGMVLGQGALGGDLSHVRRVGVEPPPTRPAAVAWAAPSDGRSEVLAAGRQVFQQQCARCHGANAEGKVGPRLVETRLDQAFIEKTVTDGRWPVMPAFGGKLSPEQIQRVSAYVRSLGTEGKP